MKKKILAFVFLVALSAHFVSCSSDSSSSTNPALPTLTTVAATDIAATTAKVGGEVTADGGHAIIARGICYSTTANPNIEDQVTVETGTTGTFTSELTGLTANTIYYARAYATNSEGTAYGSQVTFTTLTAPTTSISFKYNNVQYNFIAETFDDTKKDIRGSDGINMDYKIINLYMPLNPTLGTHTITDDPFNANSYEGHYHHTPDFLAFSGTSGQIVITTLTSTTIAGTFNFTGEDGNGDPVSVTNGTFTSTRNQL